MVPCFIFFYAFFLFTAFGRESEKPVEKIESPAKTEPLYVIQPNDILEVFVWKEPELTRKVLVRPDGCISFPLVQDLKASGITPAELKVKVEERLLEYLSAPEVTIIVEAINSYRIYILGKVQKPGSINVEKPITVLQALALAGGFAEFADENDMTVIRTLGKMHIVLPFHYKDVISGKKAGQNVMLESGDVVVVP